MAQVEMIKIFLGSPSDVKGERQHAKKVVEELNQSLCPALEVVLNLTTSAHPFPGFGKDGQAIINEQIGDMQTYDLFVAIFWNRIGTPTKRDISGTVEEFKRALKALQTKKKPQIWLYFSNAPANLSTKEKLEQKNGVVTFRESVCNRGLLKEYQNPRDFADQFRRHLTTWLQDRVSKNEKASKQRESAPSLKNQQQSTVQHSATQEVASRKATLPVVSAASVDTQIPSSADETASAEPLPGRSPPPPIFLTELDVLELFCLASAQPMPVNADAYTCQQAFCKALAKYLLSFVERLKPMSSVNSSSQDLVINLADYMPETHQSTQHITREQNEDDLPEPIEFEQVIFLVPARRLSRNLRLLQQYQEKWPHLQADHTITKESVDALTEMRRIANDIDSLFDPVKERFDGCRRERDELRIASRELEDLFGSLPSQLASREVSPDILDKMNGCCVNIAYYINCCCQWLTALAEGLELNSA